MSICVYQRIFTHATERTSVRLHEGAQSATGPFYLLAQCQPVSTHFERRVETCYSLPLKIPY